MRNHSNRIFDVILMVSCVAGLALNCGCATTANDKANSFQVGPSYQPKLAEVTGTVDFKMAPPLGRQDLTHIYSRSVTRTRSNNQLLNEREETVDFAVKSEVKSIDPKTGDRTVNIETVRKDGPVDLYDLGYPELGEAIEYIYSNKAIVKKAGNFPNNSLFFLPPVSLPKNPVGIGETWTIEVQWISLRNGLPMSVEMVSIFKRLFKCGTSGVCAEVELSGDIKVPEAMAKTAKLSSRVTGRLLVNVETGVIVWSDIRNVEKLVTGDDEMDIYSCTESLLEEPASEHWPWRATSNCDPSQPAPLFVPGFKP